MWAINPKIVKAIVTVKEEITDGIWVDKKESNITKSCRKWFFFKKEVVTKEIPGRYENINTHSLFVPDWDTMFVKDGRIYKKAEITIYFFTKNDMPVHKYYDTFEEATKKAEVLLTLCPEIKIFFDFKKNED
jgi:hypothetical protein